MRPVLTLLILSGALAAQTNPAEQAGAIHGTILDSAGSPLPGVAVEAFFGAQPVTVNLGNGRVGRIVNGTYAGRSNASGNYTVTNLSPGTYFVRNDRDTAASDYQQVVVAAGDDVALDFVVPANCTLSGRVFDSKGKPVPQAPVYLLAYGYRNGMLRPALIGPKQTNAGGVYLFDYGLHSKLKYYVLVERKIPEDLQGLETLEASTYHPSAHSFAGALPVTLQPGEQRDGVDIKIAQAPFYCVAGKVVEGSGEFTIQDAALAGSSLNRAGGKVDSQGNYRVCGITPGDYRLSEGNAYTEFTVAKSDVEHADLSVAPAHLRLQLEWDDAETAPAPTVNLYGNVSATLGVDVSANSNGGPVQLQAFLVRITLTGVDGDSTFQFAAKVPSEFSFTRDVFPGAYTLEFGTANSGAYYPKEITLDGARISDGIVRLSPGANGTLRLLLARDVANVNVTVVDPDGKALPHANVLLVPESVTTARQLSRDGVHGTADQNGIYTSAPLLPGKYRVLATAQTVRWSIPEDLERVMSVLLQAKDVEVAPKGTAQVAVSPLVIY